MVAAKCVKSAKIRNEWLKGKEIKDEKNIRSPSEVDASTTGSLSTTSKDVALNDFRIETSLLRQLRHPNICMLLAYSNMKGYEIMISELMKCSLLDVFKVHKIQGSSMPMKKKLRYAIELAKGMNYLHTCRPPVLHRDLKVSPDRTLKPPGRCLYSHARLTNPVIICVLVVVLVFFPIVLTLQYPGPAV